MMRDTALYYPLRNLVGVRIEGLWPGLKKLAAAVLNEDMHAAGIAHDPVHLVFFFWWSVAYGDETSVHVWWNEQLT